MDTLFDEPSAREGLYLIEQAFLAISSATNITEEFPEILPASKTFFNSIQHAYDEAAELSFLDLYCQIHRSGSAYSTSERETLDEKKGYFNHPGGISPLLMAKPYISEDAIVADLGAGNGLQGLLFQLLYPHQKTLQIELSAEMIRIGKMFQAALGIAEEKIEWVNDDIMNVAMDEIDFLYLYRPSKPIKEGLALYENLEKKLNNRAKPLTIFSIADCLKAYLSEDYEEFYNDGHLTCFRSICHA